MVSCGVDLQNGLLSLTPVLPEIWRLLSCRSPASLPCRRPAVSPLRRRVSEVSFLAEAAFSLFQPIQPCQPAGHPYSPSLHRCAAQNGWCLGSAPAPAFPIVPGSPAG